MAVSEVGLLGAGSRKLGGMFAVLFFLWEQPESKTIRFAAKRRSRSFMDGDSHSDFFEDQVV